MTTTINPSPSRKPGTKLCMAVTKQGVTAYGNRDAFESLSEWFKWLAASDPAEHYECHLIWHLQDDASAFRKQSIKNVFALFTAKTKPVFEKESEDGFGFEMTFMMAPEAELDELAVCQETELLPESWNEEERLVKGCEDRRRNKPPMNAIRRAIQNR
jgi:hypothetical protein